MMALGIFLLHDEGKREKANRSFSARAVYYSRLTGCLFSCKLPKDVVSLLVLKNNQDVKLAGKLPSVKKYCVLED